MKMFNCGRQGLLGNMRFVNSFISPKLVLVREFRVWLFRFLVKSKTGAENMVAIFKILLKEAVISAGLSHTFLDRRMPGWGLSKSKFIIVLLKSFLRLIDGGF